VPTFCRHNRFIERCPICSKTLPGNEPSANGGAARPSSSPRSRSARSPSRQRGGPALRVHREARSLDDGYRCELAPGLRASADALRLAEEIAFASGRLAVLAADPPGLYAEARALGVAGGEGLERATWTCFLIAYLCPLQDASPADGQDPFAGVRLALAAAPDPLTGELPALDEVPLGPLTSHDPARGPATLVAYREWVRRAGPSQAIAFTGDPAWSPERRFERVFERLALPGFARIGRYELLVVLGRLGLYELRADALHLSAGARSLAAEDATILAAKRVFGIGDPLLLERRAQTLAEAAAVPIEALDLALANWAAPQPATLGVPRQSSDGDAFERAGEALGL
jgi:hypothetical protein